MSSSSTFSWLIRTGQFWKVRAEVWAGLIMIASVIIALLAIIGICFAGPTLIWIALIASAVGLLTRFGSIALKYCAIRCPRCRHNPSRQRGSGKWLPEEQLQDCLATMEKCPACSYRGEERAV